MTLVSTEKSINNEELFEAKFLPHADALYNFAFHFNL